MSWRKIMVVVVVLLIALPSGFFVASDKIRGVLPKSVVAKLAGVFFTSDKLARLLPPSLPANKPIEKSIWLKQNWTEQERFWFHHASQGTSTLPLPYEWFVALEQPGLSFMGDSTLFRDPEYLRQFGFLPSPRSLNTSRHTLERYGYWKDGTYGHDTADAPERREASAPFPPALQKRLPENVDGLPVGFARTPGYKDPITGADLPDQIGFTCAACHTGQFEYHGVSVRYDGGSSPINLAAFQDALGLALYYTVKIPGRLHRFTDRVLGLNHSREDFEKLKDRLKQLAVLGREVKEREHEILFERGEKLGHPVGDVEEGFGRLDALNRIGNQVFYKNFLFADEQRDDRKASEALKFDVSDNLAPRTAPVSFPPLWDTPWFLWAQYDASILQPMVRNAGEALGVAAKINLVKPGADGKALFRSALDVEDLHNIETQLGKEHPLSGAERHFNGLRSPAWPADLFANDGKWQIDQSKVTKGRKLYAELCEECHRQPVNDRKFNAETGKGDFWTSNAWQPLPAEFAGPPGGNATTEGAAVRTAYYQVVQKKATDMGTDPELAKIMSERTVKLPAFLKIDASRDLARWACPDIAHTDGDVLFSLALMVVVDKTVQHWMDENGTSPEQRKDWIGDRANCPNAKTHHYRARPLDGVWATAPYLHNGSVPSLWALLSPVPDKERPKQFCTGLREFDPVRVGYDTSCVNGTTPFDTEIAGNHNTGHEFTADHSDMSKFGPGQLGRKLLPDERENLIEYLKTL